MTRIRLTAILTALLLGGAAVLTGCGGGGGGDDLSGLSTTKLLAKAKAEIAKEKYVRLKGALEDQGQQTGLDFSYVGDDAHGTITVQNATVEIETVGGKTYFKPSDDFWTAQLGASQAAQVIKVVNGRWIIADASDASFGDLISLAGKDFITKNVLKPSSKITKGKAKKVNGVDCITLKTTDGTLYLDKKTARPVEIVGNESGKGTATFSYDKVDAPTAPTQAEQVDLSALGG